MLSYKEYKLLNESLYGAFNLGLRGPATVGGIVSGSPINGTAAAEEAIEEAKKAKKMKKKMDGEMEDSDEEEDKEDEVVDKVDSSDKEDEDEGDHEDEDSDDEGDEDEDEDSEEEEKPAADAEKKDFAFMKKKMKKKSKKEWSDFMSDLGSILEGMDDEESLSEVKKGLEMMKKGMEKGMKKGMDCGCKKKCGKYMNEEDQKWWNSVNSMVNSDPNHKAWDGWSEVGEVQQSIREDGDINEAGIANTVANFAGRAANAVGGAVGGTIDAMDSMARKIGGIGSGNRAVATNFEDISNQINNLFIKMYDAKMDFQMNTANQGVVRNALRGLQSVMSRPNAMATDFLNSLQHVLDAMGQVVELGQTQPKA